MKLITYIKDTISITIILTHLDKEVEAPKMQRARAPPDNYKICSNSRVMLSLTIGLIKQSVGKNPAYNDVRLRKKHLRK